MKKNKNKQQVMAVVEELIGDMASPTDPNGSYTGLPHTQGEVPVQDSDDL